MGLSRASKYLAAGKKIVVTARDKYRKAYERGEQRPGVQKAKAQMKYGYRP